jgi:ADP-ribose pyrophosphatase YjhB (NUDIX family)
MGWYIILMPHIHDKIDFTVGVFIVCENAVLLRKHDKYNEWLAVGGHIELNEDPIEAILREAKEEVGLEIKLAGEVANIVEGEEKQLLPPRFLNRHHITLDHEHVDFIYFARSATKKFVEGEGESSQGIRWFTIQDLNNPEYKLLAPIRHYAEVALRTLAS